MKSITTIRRMFVLLTFFCCTLPAATAKTVTKNYTVKEFSKLKAGSAFQVEFIQSNENKVSIEIDEDEAEDVFVGNSGDELVIKMKDYTSSNSDVMKAKVYGKSLSSLSISGASAFTSTHTFTEDDFHLRGSGASKIEISINTKKLVAEISGASKLVVKGNAASQNIELSGASYYNAKNCKSNDIHIEASGASKATLDCTNSLHAEASGASHIMYVGKPKEINQDTSGASSVEQE